MSSPGPERPPAGPFAAAAAGGALADPELALAAPDEAGHALAPWPAWEGAPRAFPVAVPFPAPAQRPGLWRGFLRGARLPLLVVALYTALFNLSVVRGNSMAPGIHDGDRILVEPWSYLFGEVRRGDVVVLRYPLDPSVDYLKRVVGVPGDVVVVRGGRVWINDDLLEEPYVSFQDPHSVVRTVVRDGHYFVLGDNRPRSSDSRDFGQVPQAYLRGRVDLRLWPLDRAGWIR